MTGWSTTQGQFQVSDRRANVRNDGALTGVPDDVAVEVPAVVNAKGIQPLCVEPLPRKVLRAAPARQMLIRQCILPEWLRMEQSLEAYKTGDRSMLLYGVLDRPQTRSYDQAVAVLDELLDMEGHEEMDDHSSGRRIGVPTAAIPMARRTGD